MVWLGLIFSVFTVGVPMGVLTVGRRVVTYRITGRQHRRAQRGSLLLLLAAAMWSATSLLLWLAWAWPRDALFDLRITDLLLHLLPLLLGWLPASLFVITSWPKGAGYATEVPGWVRWMDALWMG